MQEHYCLTDKEFSALNKKDVGVSELYTALRIFDPIKSGKKISAINLLYAIDERRAPFKKPFTAWKLIFKVLFEKLSAKEKLEIMKYIEEKF